MLLADLFDELVPALYLHTKNIRGNIRIQRMCFVMSHALLFQPVRLVVVVQNIISSFVMIVIVFGFDVYAAGQTSFLNMVYLASIVRHAESVIEQINVHGEVRSLYVEAVVQSSCAKGTDVANAVHDDIYELVEYVYEESDDYGLGGVPIRPRILRADEVEYKEHDVVFSEIQEVVIQGIRDAKYTIWAAVAWLSNQAIIDELMAKKRQGVHVRMIISEEDTNRPYYRQLSENFDLKLIPHHGWNDWNRMHDKFCIIDFEYVMHGSYNWTKTANFNDETLATALDRDFVKKFADEFIRLYGEGYPVQQ